MRETSRPAGRIAGTRLGVLGLLALFAVGCGGSWHNYLGDLAVRGTERVPADVAEVRRLVAAAAHSGARIRAVGSGHSSAEVAQPVDGEAWVRLDRLSQPLGYAYEKAPSERFVRIGAGATIREINELLATRGRALYNMGNYDAQTIAGAFSTGTHGSGLRHAPIHDRVVAIELVTDELDRASGTRRQRLVRLEPTDGITDRATFAARARGPIEGDPEGDMVLEQDDEVFRAALLGLGNFGVIVAVTVDTRESFWLEEREELHTWDAADPPPVARWARENPEFLMIQLMPHAMLSTDYAGKVIYMKTVRREVPSCDAPPAKRPPSRETLGRLIGATLGSGFLEERGLVAPRSTLELLLATFQERAARRFRSRSDLVSINSLAPYITATSVDLWVPLDRSEAAIQKVIDLAREFGTANPGPVEAEWWHTSPLGMRVVGPSRALLAPSFDGPRLSIEIPLLVDTRRSPGDEAEFARHELYRERMLRRLTDALTAPEIGGRPHWGQRNFFGYREARAMYGENFDRWVAVYRRFNAFGTFANAFTDRLCLSNQDAPRCGDVPKTGP